MEVVGIERHGCEEGRDWAGERYQKKRPEKDRRKESGVEEDRSWLGRLIEMIMQNELVDGESMKYEKMKIYEI